MTLREERLLKDQARNALRVLSRNKEVTRQDCFPNEGAKKFKRYHKDFLSRLVEAGVIEKFESDGPNIPSRYRVKNAQRLVQVHDDEVELVNMVWGDESAAVLAAAEAANPIQPVVVEQPAPQPSEAAVTIAPVAVPPPTPASPNGPEPFVPPATEPQPLKEIEEAMVRLLTIDNAIAELLVWMKDTVHKLDKRTAAMEKKVDELVEMWRTNG